MRTQTNECIRNAKCHPWEHNSGAWMEKRKMLAAYFTRQIRLSSMNNCGKMRKRGGRKIAREHSLRTFRPYGELGTASEIERTQTKRARHYEHTIWSVFITSSMRRRLSYFVILCMASGGGGLVLRKEINSGFEREKKSKMKKCFEMTMLSLANFIISRFMTLNLNNHALRTHRFTALYTHTSGERKRARAESRDEVYGSERKRRRRRSLHSISFILHAKSIYMYFCIFICSGRCCCCFCCCFGSFLYSPHTY